MLGSLINPSGGEGDLLVADFSELRPLLERALSQEAKDVTTHEIAVTARGLAKAAEILASKFTIVATNVPYLGRGKQNELLMEYCERFHPAAKADLATCFVERCLAFCASGASVSLVTPQNWLFLGGYQDLRVHLLKEFEWVCVARLGENGFNSTQAAGAFTALVCLTKRKSSASHSFPGVDVSDEVSPRDKCKNLQSNIVRLLGQKAQLDNPDSRIMFIDSAGIKTRLEEYTESYQGAVTGDLQRFVGYFWEVAPSWNVWERFRTAIDSPNSDNGLSCAIRWEKGVGQLSEYARLTRDQLHDMHESGQKAWGRRGVAVNRMRELNSTLFLGEKFDNNVAVLIPKAPEFLLPILAFCTSKEFAVATRALDQTIKVTNQTLRKVPFDLAYWQKKAAEKYPAGLPKPFSCDPTQWVFNGHPYKSDNPLQVAVARLLCCQWPRQTGASFPDCPELGLDGLERHTDDDGIVALSSINREEAAAVRLRALLNDAYGSDWQDGVTERQLLADAGHGDSTLEEWLRNSFFEEHCKLFHHRPFVWHIWDGERDGFHALVNYHRLAAPNGEGARLLQKLAQTYLGDWIARCEADVKNEKTNAHKLLKAAKDLQADLLKILEGEAPHDIFVRWKPLHEQSIGWNPDINDGVRLNIRPFLTVRDVGKKGAGLLRWKPNTKWDKDRGSEPERPKVQFPWFWSCLPEDKTDHVTDFAGGTEFTGERWNNLHYSLAIKKAARAKFSPKK